MSIAQWWATLQRRKRLKISAQTAANVRHMLRSGMYGDPAFLRMD